MCPRSQYICRLNHSPQSQMLWNTTSFYVLNQLSFDSMPVPAWNSTVISIVSIVTTYTRDPSVARKMGEEAVLSGGPCWSPLLLSKLAAVRWSPVFLHLHATCGYGNAYQGRKPHTWAPTPTVMRLDVMMTARKHTIHAVISARNMRALLELTFHLFLIIVSFFLSNHCFLFPDCFSILLHFCLYLSLGFPQFPSYCLFFGPPFSQEHLAKSSCPKLHSFCGTASCSSFWDSLLCTSEFNPLFLGCFPLSRFDFLYCWSMHSNNCLKKK